MTAMTLEPTTAREPFTYRIDGTQLAATRVKIEKINARAAKKGLGGRLELAVTPVEVAELDEVTGMLRTWVEYDVVIGGQAPSYDGWEFIATLDWDANAGLIVRAVPGAVQVERDNLVEGYCDHCKVSRGRRATFVVRSQDTGAQLQVGRSCIKDFLGWSGAVSFPSDALTEDDELGGGFFGARGEREFTPATVLAYAWAIIKEHGFVPASSYSGNTTSSQVRRALYPSTDRRTGDMEFARSIAPLAAEAAERAAEIAAFIASDAFSGTGDYVINLKAVAAGEFVSFRNIGILASAPQAFARYQEQTLIRERKAKIGENSAHFGAVGTRYELAVTVVGVRYTEGDYGTTTIYTLVDADGNVFKWFASNDEVLGDKEGETFKIKGTVKKHDEYQGTKQTVLSRCALVK